MKFLILMQNYNGEMRGDIYFLTNSRSNIRYQISNGSVNQNQDKTKKMARKGREPTLGGTARRDAMLLNQNQEKILISVPSSYATL